MGFVGICFALCCVNWIMMQWDARFYKDTFSLIPPGF